MNLWGDIRFGVRLLARAPGFTVTAAAILALGIGMAGAAFSMVSGVRLNLVPWPAPSDVVQITDATMADADEQSVAPGRYLDWAREARSFSGMFAVQQLRVNITDRNSSSLVEAARVTSGGFELSGLSVALGRGLSRADCEPGAEPVVMLTHALWNRSYGGDPGLVGRQLQIDGRSVTVVGILPPKRWFPFPWVEAVLPLSLAGQDSRAERTLSVLARLAPGATVESAQAEMGVIARRLAAAYPATDAGGGGWVELLRDAFVPASARAGVWLVVLGAVLVLVLACVNVAGLQLARGAARQQELALRAALGASAHRLVVLQLSEALVLAVLVLPLGLAATRILLSALIAVVPRAQFFVADFFRLDAPVVIALSLASLSTVVLFGLPPALAGARVDLQRVLKDAGERGSTGRPRLRALLVVAQTAAALLLLVCSVLLLQRFRALQELDPGFRAHQLLVTSVALPERYPDPPHWRAFEEQIRQRLATSPEVLGVSASSWLPLGLSGDQRELHIEGRPVTPGEAVPNALWMSVSPSYFPTLGLKVMEGRLLEDTDREGTRPVAVVTAAFARRYFPQGSVLGAKLSFPKDGLTREVVGVVSDAYQFSVTDPPRPQIYVAFDQAPSSSVHVALRTRGEPLASAAWLRAEFKSLDPELPLFAIESMRGRLDDSLWTERLLKNVAVALTLVALALTVLGIYGLASYSSARRTGEFGIRAALGARPRSLAGLVLRESGALVGTGIAIGVFLAWAAGVALTRALPAMPGMRVALLAPAASVLVVVALLASLLPALRAARSDPMRLLRRN